MDKVKHFAVYQVGGPIYGVGLNKETAMIDAQQWVDERSKDENGNVIVQDDNRIDGNLCLAECSEEVFLKAADTGGDFRYIDEGTRPYNCLYLPGEVMKINGIEISPAVYKYAEDISKIWRTAKPEEVLQGTFDYFKIGKVVRQG